MHKVLGFDLAFVQDQRTYLTLIIIWKIFYCVWSYFRIIAGVQQSIKRALFLFLNNSMAYAIDLLYTGTELI